MTTTDLVAVYKPSQSGQGKLTRIACHSNTEKQSHLYICKSNGIAGAVATDTVRTDRQGLPAREAAEQRPSGTFPILGVGVARRGCDREAGGLAGE